MVYNYFIVFFYSIFLFLNFIFSEQASVDLFAPSEVGAGERFLVSITLDKEDLQGFARFQQRLPHGIKAIRNQSANAEFSFKDHKVKYIWLNLPEEEKVTLSYYLEIDERVMGNFNLGGTFSFISNNERRSVNISAQSVHITPSPNVAYSIDINEFREDFDYTQVREDLIACIRQKPYLDENSGQYIVNLIVYKKDQEKFAKIEENLPAGLTAVAEESQDPIFTFRNNIAKYIWMNLPSDPYFVISYNLLKGDFSGTDIDIDGQFSYIENGTTQIVEIVERDDIDLTNTDLAYLQSVVESSYDLIAKASRRSQASDIIEVKEKTPVADRGELTPILDPEEGVYYRVQLAAGHKPVDINRYFRKYNLKHEVKLEKHEGWIKYSIGAFTTYKDARDYRVYIWNTTVIDDAFVAAYNNGIRITVQEALMIANQKWYR